MTVYVFSARCASMVGYNAIADQPIFLREPGCIGVSVFQVESRMGVN